MFELWKMGKQKQHPSKWKETVGLLLFGVKFDLRTVFFLQNVWAQLLPPFGEGPSRDAVRPRPSQQRREDRRNCHWPGKPLPVQVRSHVWPPTLLLCVSGHRYPAVSVFGDSGGCFFFFLLLSVRSGVNQWRDQLTPRQLLARLCERRNLRKPVYDDNGVRFRGLRYTAADLGESWTKTTHHKSSPKICQSDRILWNKLYSSSITLMGKVLQKSFNMSLFIHFEVAYDPFLSNLCFEVNFCL